MRAFARAAPFIGKNMEIDNQREYILNQLFKAAVIQDEDVIEYLMQAFVDIVRVGYENLGNYIEQIGTLTVSVLDSEYEKSNTLAMEVWTTFCEVEIEKLSKGLPTLEVVNRYSGSILTIIKKALDKSNGDVEDPDLSGKDDWNLIGASGMCLERMAEIAKDAILPTI